MGEDGQRGPPPPSPRPAAQPVGAPCRAAVLASKPGPKNAAPQPPSPGADPLQPGWLVRGCPESSVPRRGMRCGGTCTERARAPAPVGHGFGAPPGSPPSTRRSGCPSSGKGWGQRRPSGATASAKVSGDGVP